MNRPHPGGDRPPAGLADSDIVTEPDGSGVAGGASGGGGGGSSLPGHLFDEEGYRTLSLRAVRDNNLLTPQRTAE